MVLLLFVLFIAVPIAEIYVIIQVGQAIGALWTIALLIADSILGTMLMRAQGRAVWRRFNLALKEGRPPAREVLDGVLVIVGGAFLLAPGFLTDAVGLSLLLPPTRAFYRALLLRNVAARVVVGVSDRLPGRGSRGRRGAVRGPDRTDVEGTAHEVDPQQLPRDPRSPDAPR